MNGLEAVMRILGAVGAYFSVVLVLAIVVETVLDSIKENEWITEKVGDKAWLSFLDIKRHRVSPDQAMRDVAYWVPPKSQAEAQIAVLNNLAKEFDVTLDKMTEAADASLKTAKDIVAMTGISKQAAQTQAILARKLYLIRHSYNDSESKRISRLRRVSAVIGTLIAIGLQLNTFAFLQELIPVEMDMLLTMPGMQIAGMILTGFASSMGSSFWHDQLDKVRAVKESTRTLHSLGRSVA